MSVSSISGTVTHTVTLGAGRYSSPLTITRTGNVAPIAYGANGIFVHAGLADASITNRGLITGGLGSESMNGGIGIDAAAMLSLHNSGAIIGGAGSAVGDGSHRGGVGVALRVGGIIANTGRITGGEGSYPYTATGSGGSGVQISGGTLRNSGTIAGGDGYYYGSSGNGGEGGIGIDLTKDSSAANSGNIYGGDGTYGKDTARPGGIAAELNASRLNNTGNIVGGYGGYGFYSDADGGIGVSLSNRATLTNGGTIIGGHGGAGYVYGGNGGDGLSVHNAAATNNAVIIGGTGGTGANDSDGAGGAGVSLQDAIFTNTGTVTGGAGGAGNYNSQGGVGVILDGGTLTTAGTVAGGYCYNSDGSRGPVGHAVSFGPRTGTIVIERGAIFHGAISGFATGDVFDSTTKITSLTFIGGTLTLEHNQTVVETLSLAGTFTAANFHLASDGHGGTDITYGSASPGQPPPDFATSAIIPEPVAAAAFHTAALPPGSHFGHYDGASPAITLAVGADHLKIW